MSAPYQPPSPGRRRFLTQGAALAGTAVSAGALGAAGLSGRAAAAQPDEQRYHQQVVLITGATSGIGAATARLYATLGARVFFCGRREELGEQVATEIREAGGEATFMPADVREEEQVKALVTACVDTYGQLDIAFNNAGIEGPRGDLDDIPMTGTNSYTDVMATNVDGVYYGLRHQIPVMREQGRGVIVNTGSMLSHRGSNFAGAYAGSKHAVIGLTRSAAQQEAGNGIRVLSVSPGGVRTELLRRFMGVDSLEGAGADNPMGRIAEPEEVADVVVQLTAPEAVFLNGDDIKIDGAQSA